MNTPGFHIQNLSRMFHYQLSSNVERTLNILEFCVLVDFRIQLLIRPEVDVGFHRRMNIFHFTAFVLYASVGRTFPTPPGKTERSCSCTDGSCIPFFSILVMTQQVSLTS